MADLLSIFPLNGNQETTREFTSKKGIVSKINDAEELPEDIFPMNLKTIYQYQQKDSSLKAKYDMGEFQKGSF